MTSDRRPADSLLVSPHAHLPYSKGLMARTLMGTGLTPERAYALAQLIETELVRTHADAPISVGRLY